VSGELVVPAAVKDIGLMTVEGGADDISCPGQTYAAHGLCSSIPDSRRKHLLVEGCGHYGIFSGSRWRNVVCPSIREFIAGERALSKPAAAKTAPKTAPKATPKAAAKRKSK
jgi:poly(3-hydroxybutyrate) depolymerase